MPPRNANWPTSSTNGARSKPRSSRADTTRGSPGVVAFARVRRSLARWSGTGARSCSARWVVTSSLALPEKRASTASTLRPPISRWGSSDS